MLALHYACGARCSREVLYLLLMSFPQAALRADPNGMLPLHYLAQWGPSEAGAVEMVCVATGHKVSGVRDGDGNTPEMLAANADYEGHDEVARKIRDFGSRFQQQTNAGGGSVPRTPSSGGLDLTFGSGITAGSKKRTDLFVETNTDEVRGGMKTTVRNNHHPNHHRNNSEPSTDRYLSFEDDGVKVRAPSRQGEADYVSNANNNENNLNSWNMSPRTDRQAMDKLGVSPRNHKYRHSIGGEFSIENYSSMDQAETAKVGNYRHSVGGGGNYSIQQSSLDHAEPVNFSRRIQNLETNVFTRDFSSKYSPRNADSRSTSAPAATDSRRSSSTPRNFGSTGNVIRSIPSLTNEHATPKIIHSNIYKPQYDPIPSPSSSYTATYTSGLPPKSPRYSSTTPKSGVGNGSYQYPSSPAQQLESREPEPTRAPRIREPDLRSPTSIMQDRRLSVLREELSTMHAVGGDSTNGIIIRSPTVPSVRFLEDEVREPPPRGNYIERNLSIRTDQYGSMQDSSQSTASYGTQLTQQLQVLHETEQHRNEQMELEEMRLRESIDAAKAKERDEAIRAIQREKEQRENVLLEEIQRLRVGKEQAEAALSEIATMGPLAVIYSGSEDVSKDDEAYRDDDVSKLTFFDGSELASQIVRERNENVAVDKTITMTVIGEDSATSSRESQHNDVERLLMEKAEIEHAIQQAMLIQRDKELSALSSASNENTHMVSDDRKQLDKKIAELSEQVLREQRRYTELEKQHSEAVYNHLQEVTSLRVSFDKAKSDIEMYRSSAEAEHEANEKKWNEERRKFEAQAEVKMDEALVIKEHEWNNERSTLEKQIEEYKAKCETAQTEIEDYQKDAKSLREGFDKARIEIDKYRDVAARVHNTKETEWNEERRILEEQIMVLNNKLSMSQGEELKLRTLLASNEVKWIEERGRLEKEIELMIGNRVTTSDSNSSTASSFKTDCTNNRVESSLGNESTPEVHLRMQLTNAVKEAEDMRNFNSVIRKEHDMTIESLESELKEERKSKTECLSQIVMLQYKISMLEQDLADAKAEADKKLMEPTSRHRGHESASYNSSCNDSQSYSQSYHSAENSRSLELEVYKLKEALTEKIDEAKKYRRELDTLKEKMDEADKKKIVWSDSSAEYEEQIRDLKKKIQRMQEKEDTMVTPLVFDAAIQVGQCDSGKPRERALLEQVNECNDKIRELQKNHDQELIEREDAFRAELRDTKKKFGDSLREQEKMYLWKLRDAKKDVEKNEWDDCYDMVRELKKEHERDLIEKEDSFRVKLRDQEEIYLEKMRDLKRKEDPYSSREIDKLMKQKDESYEKRIKKMIAEKEEDFNLRIKDIIASKDREYEHTISDLEETIRTLKEIIGTKDEEFDIQVSKLEDDIQQLKGELKKVREMEGEIKKLKGELKKGRELEDEVKKLKGELKVVTKDKSFIAEQHEIQVELLEDEIQTLQQELEMVTKNDDRKSELSECKKELDRQRRKHRSEINQLNNTLEMQKSKQERLQSHIQSLEKQISDMVNDYESQLLNAMYGNVNDV